MIAQYVKAPGPAQLQSQPLLDEAIAVGGMWKRFVPVPKGVYYLVVDHSAVGRTQPQVAPGDDRAAKVDYVVQVAERP
jgi:hypothetical protein